MIDVELLKKVPLFTGLTDEQLRTLQPYMKKSVFAQDECIVREHTTGDLIYMLAEGTAVVTKDLVMGFDDDRASTEKVLTTLNSQNLPTFGENGILGHAPRTANVIAQTPCTLYTLSKADFESFAGQDYQAGYLVMLNIARIISMRLSATDTNVVKLATALYIAAQNH
jgi:CRP-like cAMP-binding protein